MDLGGVREGNEYDRNKLYEILKELIKTEGKRGKSQRWAGEAGNKYQNLR